MDARCASSGGHSKEAALRTHDEGEDGRGLVSNIEDRERVSERGGGARRGESSISLAAPRPFPGPQAEGARRGEVIERTFDDAPGL